MKSYTIEREGQIDFFKTFRIDYENNEVLIENTDGVVKGNLLEFKLHIDDLNKVLFQAIKYLSKMRVKGHSIPANILLISLNDELCYVFKSADYLEEIHQIYLGGASKGNEGFILHSEPLKFDYSSKQLLQQSKLLKILQTSDYTPIRIDENCIVGWAKRYYRENPTAKKGDFLGDTEGEVRIVGEIRRPKHFEGHIVPYTGRTNEKFKYLMDMLNDELARKNLGAFYTPELYCKKTAELLTEAIQRVPAGNDYIILDRCAGTGNLEAVLTEEQLSHCILSTYEYYEYKVLVERLGDKVRHIIPPIETEDTYDKGFVKTANALSKEYLENEIIGEYLNNEKCTIILYENPPYAETTSIQQQQKKTSKESSLWKQNYIVEQMKNEVSGSTINDMGNVFIWSAFKYYLRQPTDSYIIYSPIKYWKAQHLINKQLVKGFAFNRKHFHAPTPACVVAALWSNIEDSTTTSFSVEGFDIKDNSLVSIGLLPITKIYNRYSEVYYDKRTSSSDSFDGILTGLNGSESNGDSKKRLKPRYSSDIIGYLVADSFSFDNPNSKSSLLVAGRYNGNGFYLRKDNFIEKLPLFAATRYTCYNTSWTEYGRIMKSGDGFQRYLNDVRNGKLDTQLLKILFYCTLEPHNHMKSFSGSDGRFYRNEICLDSTNGETIATTNLKEFKPNKAESLLLEVWNQILEESKKTDNYNPNLTYGVHQIDSELNTTFKNDSGKKVYDYPLLNGHIKTLKTLLKAYYLKEIVPFLFKYEFLK